MIDIAIVSVSFRDVFGWVGLVFASQKSADAGLSSPPLSLELFWSHNADDTKFEGGKS